MFKKLACCIIIASTSTLAIGEDLNSALNKANQQIQNSAPGDANRYPTTPEDLLTGDTRLACEATLCLSTAHRPGECNPSIRRYFSIKHRKMGDTIRARHNFLKQCPASNEPGMPELVRAIANGAGRCDASELNRVMKRTGVKRVRVQKSGRDGYNFWQDVQYSYISSQKPAYCSVYFDHEWTQVGTRYVGQEQDGGRWVD